MENPPPSFLFRRCLTFLAFAVGLSGCVVTPPDGPVSVSTHRGQAADPAELDRVPVLEPRNREFAEALAYFSQALSHEIQGNIPGAVTNYLQSIQRDPDNETLYMLAARRLLAQGEKEQAFSLMRALQARSPDNARPHVWLAVLHLALNEEEPALVSLLKATGLEPGLESPYLEAARLLVRKEREDEALELLGRAVEKAHEPLRATRMRVELLFRKISRTLDATEAGHVRSVIRGELARARTRFPEETAFTFQAAALEAREDNVLAMIEIYRALDAREPNGLAVRQTIVLHYANALGNASVAAAKLDAYLRQRPDDAFVHYLRGQLYEMEGKNEAALASYLRAVELKPSDTTSAMQAAIFLTGKGKRDEAMALLQSTRQRQPDDLRLRQLTGNLYMDLGDFKEALAIFQTIEKAIAQGKEMENPANFHHSHAIALLAEGQTQKAAASLERAVRKNLRYLDMFWRRHMVHALRALPDTELADQRRALLLECLEILADRMPGEAEIAKSIGRHHLVLSRFPEAVKAFEAARAIAEEKADAGKSLDADFFYDYGSALERAGQFDAAERQLERAVTLNPEHANAYNHLAYMWAEQSRNLERAMEYVTRALRMEPDNGAFIDTRGWILYMQGKYSAAYGDLLRASELIDNDPVITEHLGDVLVKLDRLVEAIGYYRIALELDKGDRRDILQKSLRHAEDALSASLAPPPPPAPEPEPGPVGEALPEPEPDAVPLPEPMDVPEEPADLPEETVVPGEAGAPEAQEAPAEPSDGDPPADANGVEDTEDGLAPAPEKAQ